VNGDGVWQIFGDFESTPNAILHKDLTTISRSAIVFFNLTPFGEHGLIDYKIGPDSIYGDMFGLSGTMHSGHPLVGTFIEVGIAVVYRKLIVVVTSDPYLMQYPMILSAATAIVPTVERGVDFTRGLITTLVGD